MRWLQGVLAGALLASVAMPVATAQERAFSLDSVLLQGVPLPPPNPNGGQAREPAAPQEAAPAAASEPTEATEPAAAAQQAADEQWVATHEPTDLWSDSEGGVSFARVGRWAYLQLTGTSADGRLYVLNPRTGNYAWVDAEAVGPAPAPSPDALRGPPVLAAVNKLGRTIGGYNLRNWPAERSDTLIRPLAHNAAVTVYESVTGDDGDTWYRIGEGEYVHNGGVRLPRNPPRTFAGRWIDADLSEPALITAYDGDLVVSTMLAIKGTAVSPTPLGVHRISRRVANETMDSSTIGIPRNGPGGYYLRNVLYTQYFHGSGAAIHYNYWRGEFGYAGSHGCLGLNLDDSLWLWNWAGIGTVVNIRV